MTNKPKVKRYDDMGCPEQICRVDTIQESDDGDVQIRVNNGDGKDVGPAYIHGRLEFDQPYGVSGGIVCKTCQIEWLKQYIKTLEAETTEDSVYDNEQEGDWE